MATKTIKAWIDGAIQEIEVEDIVSPVPAPSLDERVEALEDKPIIADGNFLVGDGTKDAKQMTPSEVLEHINGATIVTLTTAEYEALDDDNVNANSLYLVTDSDDSSGSTGSSENCVLYTEQSLSEDEKAQARTNIGVEQAVVDILIQLDIVPVVTDGDGSVLAEDDGTILVNL